jgi:hypothetical protein
VDLDAILDQLREELDIINQSILAIARLEAGKARGPGRPPKWLTEVTASQAEPQKRGRPAGKPAAKGR